MEYPQSHFTRPWRRFMLGIFILAFLIISPLLVLYTSGYRYNFKNGIVQEIGAISIDVLPKNAIVYLGDTVLKSTMPIRLKNIVPGKYKIKLTADGYYDWDKEVVVENKQTVYIKEIKLIKKSQPQKILAGKIDKIYLSKSNKYLLYEKINKNREFWLRNLSNGQNNLIFVETKNKNYEVNWSQKNDWLIIANTDLSEIYVIDCNTPDKNWNLAKEEKNKITKIQWSNNSQTDIFYSTKNQLMITNASTRQKTPIGKNYFFDWYADNGQIWTLQSNINTKQLEIMKDTFGFAENFTKINTLQNDNNKEPDWKIIHAQDGEILLKKSGFTDMLLIAGDKQFSFSGEKFLQSDFNNWWIIWTLWEITTYSQGEEPFLLNRSGEQLNKVVVLDEYNTLGLIWANKMTALFPYYFVSHNLINKKINDAQADSQNRILYFSTMTNDEEGLWKMDY